MGIGLLLLLYDRVPIALFTRTKKRFTTADGPRCNAGIICIMKVTEAEDTCKKGHFRLLYNYSTANLCSLIVHREIPKVCSIVIKFTQYLMHAVLICTEWFFVCCKRDCLQFCFSIFFNMFSRWKHRPNVYICIFYYGGIFPKNQKPWHGEIEFVYAKCRRTRHFYISGKSLILLTI